MKSNTVFIDSSGFKALIDEKDDFYPHITTIWSRLSQEKQIKLVTSNFILDESFTLLRSKCGLLIALKLRDLLAQTKPSIKIIRITATDEANAWEYFEKDWSRLSFTDCTTFALMKRVGIARVVSFDAHFKRAGFAVEA